MSPRFFSCSTSAYVEKIALEFRAYTRPNPQERDPEHTGVMSHPRRKTEEPSAQAPKAHPARKSAAALPPVLALLRAALVALAPDQIHRRGQRVSQSGNGVETRVARVLAAWRVMQTQIFERVFVVRLHPGLRIVEAPDCIGVIRPIDHQVANVAFFQIGHHARVIPDELPSRMKRRPTSVRFFPHPSH